VLCTYPEQGQYKTKNTSAQCEYFWSRIAPCEGYAPGNEGNTRDALARRGAVPEASVARKRYRDRGNEGTAPLLANASRVFPELTGTEQRYITHSNGTGLRMPRPNSFACFFAIEVRGGSITKVKKDE
jgi:hypothetical protein